ncbi:ABC transporter permease [Actinomadura sp. HBU206391]|uniref:ABC transporter permease n=1 Tax=Actinomadura sp. HBU206391 TaxID=2731692 RepID=UPI00164FD88E|nr:ABC transporter permease [Actinomadura sp. HBU206391]MBC6462191.1 ABC transporter permease [Actinomadura sp. HBU206391]
MLDVLGAEIGKGLRVQLSHPVGHIITLLMSTTMYLGLQFVLGQGQLRDDLLPQTLVAIGGYWFLQYAALVMVADLIEEKRAGTFAQTQMTPAPPWLPMLGRLITASVFGLTVAAVAALVPMLVAGITIPLRWAALLPALLLGVNVLAFTFLLAALALASPMIGALQALFTALVLLLNGSFLPLAFYPDWLAVLARLLPTTLGVEAITRTLFEGRTLGEIWTGGTLPLLIIHTLALTVVSGVLFVRNHRRALESS